MSNNESNKENVDPANRLDEKEWPPLKVTTIVVAEKEDDSSDSSSSDSSESSDSSDSESDGSEGSGEEEEEKKEAEEKNDEEVQEKPGDDNVVIMEQEAEVKDGEQPTEHIDNEKKAKSAQEALEEKLGECFEIDDIDVHEKELPETLFGVPTRQHGSASVGIQMVTFAEIRDLKAEMSGMVDDNNTAAGHVKAIHDMMRTITEAEKEGNKTWKKNTEAEMKETLAEWKKGQDEKTAEHDREIRDLKRMLAEKEEAKKNEEEPVVKMQKKAEKEAKKAAKRAEKEAEKAAKKALKRGSTSAMDGFPAKQAKAEPPAPTPPAPSSLTPEMRMKAAMAKTVEFRKKAEFSCVLCVLNDHKTAACQKYPVTTARRERLAELGRCLKCGKNHPQPCRFPARDCRFCHGPHVDFLCKSTFDD
ncbi:hypothetical protein B9Z55_021493 [Caenorhabditis nigoni]|uniref:Uncharacterized protein n=1 Tax=Caenorhabditis nigoni TaxID=1611254 RepID=A0A2G5TS64_9PELO|nr:hypothetical protein B9Z55_021493 [Caenorhabditis nigoni]